MLVWENREKCGNFLSEISAKKMGNHRKKKSHNKKPGTSQQVQETQETPENVSTVEEVQKQVEKVVEIPVADVKSTVDEIVPVANSVSFKQ